MTVRELKAYINLIKDDSIEVKMRTGYNKCRIDELNCTISGSAKMLKRENDKLVEIDSYDKSTLYLTGEVYNKDELQCKINSIQTIARLNGDAIEITDDNKMEYDQYLKLKQKFEK